MAYGKVTKNHAYFSRFQVKFKRRRQGKTDYRQRLKLCTQDKNKYNTPKYRFVVRFSNKDITCQIVSSTLLGDSVLCAAYAHELPRYGLKAGLTNYAAAYCTGLLLARRLLTKIDIADIYEGCTDVDGEDYNVEEEEDAPRPFRALLDVGLVRTSTGARVFGALKGALDGGIDIPHSEKRFAGYEPSDKALDAETHRRYIFGGHVSEYMENLREEEPEKYQSQFKGFIENEVEPEDLEDLYAAVHEAIREDPTHEKKERTKPSETKRWHAVKLTYDEKKANLKEKLLALKATAEEDEEDDE